MIIRTKNLSKVLNRYFSKVKITYFEKIPNDESGKFRYAISEIQTFQNKMKIIHFISSLGNGGAEKLSVELSNSMSKDNEVLLVSFKKLESWMYFPKNYHLGLDY